MYEVVRDRIAANLRKKNIVKIIPCPKCGSQAVLGRKVFKWNQGYEIVEYINGCGHKSEGMVTLNIG